MFFIWGVPQIRMISPSKKHLSAGLKNQSKLPADPARDRIRRSNNFSPLHFFIVPGPHPKLDPHAVN
jgi:hypothetical protein